MEDLSCEEKYCTVCAGLGYLFDGEQCGECDGEGYDPSEDDEDSEEEDEEDDEDDDGIVDVEELDV